MHGILATSDMWVLMHPQHNLVTVLADKGYDVWIPNQRGNAYSHEHKDLSSDSGNFDYWDFSAEEIALGDLPALMDHIRETTGRQRMFYVGHSMGGTLFAILCSREPERCRALDGAVLLAPVVFPPEQVRLTPVRLITNWAKSLGFTLRKARMYEFLGRNQLLVNYMYNSCLSENSLCSLLLQSIEFNQKEQNDLFRPISDYIASALGGTSVKVFEHMSYLVTKRDGKFGPLPRSWDDTSSTLLNETYTIENIQTPVAIFYGEDDIFVDDKAIDHLSSSLKNVVIKQKIPAPFKHQGFFYKLNNNYGVVKSILQFMEKYDSKRKH